MQKFCCLIAVGAGAALTLSSTIDRATAQTLDLSLQNRQSVGQPQIATPAAASLTPAATADSRSLNSPTAGDTATDDQGQNVPAGSSSIIPSNDVPVSSPASTSATDLIRLSPNPDLLELPTTPRAVEIDINQPITLQQALELARRNNRDLQVAELQLRQSRAVLRQARAAEFPTASVQAGITRTSLGSTQFGNSQIQPQQLQLDQLQTQLQQERQQAQNQLEQQLAQLQQQLQQGQDQQQQQEFQQQLQQLQQRANNAAVLPQPFQFSLLTQSNQFQSTGGTGSTGSTGIGDIGSIDGGGTGGRGTSQSGNGVSNTFNSTLSLNYDIYTSGGRSASIRSAEEQVRSAELEVERQNQQLSLDVSNDYYNIQQAEELIRVTQAAVENAQVNLRDTEAQERAGIGTRFDVLQAQVQLANAVQDLTQARNLQNISRRQLAQRLSLADAATLSSADPVEIAGRWNLSLEESIILALQNRAELAQLLAQRNIAQQQRRIALASIGPQLSAFANFNIVDQLDDSNLGAYGYAIGILVSMNFYDGGAARASAAQQEANIAIAQTQFATTKNQIRFQVEQAYFTLQSSFENIQTASTALEQARESLRLARLRFQAGVGTQLDVISAAANLTQAQGNLVAAILDYNRSLASLQRAVSNAQVPTP